MVKKRSYSVAIAIFLVAGCQQQATNSRSSPARILPPTGTVTGGFKVEGEINAESVRGYVKGHADRWKLTRISGNDFEIQSLPGGTYNLWLMGEGSKDGELLATAAPIEIKDGAKLGPFTLAPASTVKGSLKVEAERLTGLKISVPGTDFVVSPASDGTFSLTGLPATTMSLLISEPAGDVASSEGFVTEAGAEITIPEIDLIKTGDGKVPVIKTPNPTNTGKKLTGGSLILNNGVAKSGTLKVPVQFLPPTAATEILMSESITMTGDWQPIPQNYVHTFSGVGFKNLYAKYRDAVGAESDQVYGTVEINTSKPAPGTLRFVNGTTFTASRTSSLALTAAGSSSVKLALSQSELANATWRAFSPVISNFDLGTDAEGAVTVWFQLRSDYGVEGDPQSQTVSIIKTGPTIASAATKTGKAAFNNRNVGLVVTPAVVPHDVVKINVSCNGTTFDKLTFNSQTNEATVDILTSKAGCASTEGLRTLQLKLEDSLGNQGAAASLPVTYDITPPAAPSVAQADNSYSIVTAYTLSGTAAPLANVTISGATAEVTTAADGAGNWSAGVSLKTNQANTLSIVAKDEAQNASAALTRTITHDSVAPALVGTPSVKITAESFVIDFATSELTTAVVDYGETSGYGSQKTLSTPSTSHSVVLNGLSQNMVYHFRISLTDVAGNGFVSADDSRRTYIDKSALLLTSQVWDQTITPYYVSGNFRIDPGLTVRIKKGVTVALEAGTQIWVRGQLIAEGTAAEPVKFTTNNPNPQPGDWDRIEFNNTSAAAFATPYVYDGGSRLNHTVIEYGGANGAAIFINQRSLLIANSTIRHSDGFGIEIFDTLGAGTVAIRGNIVEKNGGGGLKFRIDDDQNYGQLTLLSHNIVRGNTGPAIDVTQFSGISASHNVFETGSGVKIRSVNAIFSSNIFSNLPRTFSLDSTNDFPLSLTATKNAFVGTSTDSATLMEDSPSLASTDGIYSVNFNRNTVHNYKSTAVGSALVELDHPDTYNMDYASVASATFHFNNFTNNNVGASNRYSLLSRSFREYADFDARYNFWNESSQLTVQQKYIYDYTDNVNYRAIKHQPILSVHHSGAPMAPPFNVTVTSPAAGTAVLSWQENIEPELKGYFIYYSENPDDLLSGTGAAQGNSRIDTESGAVTCSTSMSVKTCTLTGLTSGKNYYFAVSSYDAGDKDPVYFTEPGAVNLASDEITSSQHGLSEGERVRVSVDSGGTLPVGLSAVTTYWVTYIDANRFKLRTTPASGSDIDLTASGDQIITVNPLTSASFVEPGSANTGTDEISVVAHGFRDGQRVRLTVSAGGTLPSGLSAGTNYWITYVDQDTFSLRTTEAAGPKVDITAAGDQTVTVTPNFPVKAGRFLPVVDATVNAASDLITSGTAHGLVNGVRGRFTDTGTHLGLNTTSDYYVTTVSATAFKLSLDGEAVLPVDIGLTNGHKFSAQDIDLVTNTFFIQNHALQNDIPVQFTTTGILPGPFATGTNYYVVNATSHTFQLSATSGGAPLDIVSNGSPTTGTAHTMTPNFAGAGAVTFVPNYPDIIRQDYQTLGNESWFSPKVNVTVN